MWIVEILIAAIIGFFVEVVILKDRKTDLLRSLFIIGVCVAYLQVLPLIVAFPTSILVVYPIYRRVREELTKAKSFKDAL